MHRRALEIGNGSATIPRNVNGNSFCQVQGPEKAADLFPFIFTVTTFLRETYIWKKVVKMTQII